jgi:hypothetical protein
MHLFSPNKKSPLNEYLWISLNMTNIKGPSWSWLYGIWIYNNCAISAFPVQSEVYSIQHYVVKFVSYFRQVGGVLHQ